jgi:hypothetical protein
LIIFYFVVALFQGAKLSFFVVAAGVLPLLQATCATLAHAPAAAARASALAAGALNAPFALFGGLVRPRATTRTATDYCLERHEHTRTHARTHPPSSLVIIRRESTLSL